MVCTIASSRFTGPSTGYLLSTLKKYEVQTYRPIRDYGGWGIRYGRGGKAYNVSGNRGVMLELSDGQKLLIGSQKPDDLANAISSAFGKKPG